MEVEIFGFYAASATCTVCTVAVVETTVCPFFPKFPVSMSSSGSTIETTSFSFFVAQFSQLLLHHGYIIGDKRAQIAETVMPPIRRPNQRLSSNGFYSIWISSWSLLELASSNKNATTRQKRKAIVLINCSSVCYLDYMKK